MDGLFNGESRDVSPEAVTVLNDAFMSRGESDEFLNGSLHTTSREFNHSRESLLEETVDYNEEDSNGIDNLDTEQEEVPQRYQRRRKAKK